MLHQTADGPGAVIRFDWPETNNGYVYEDRILGRHNSGLTVQDFYNKKHAIVNGSDSWLSRIERGLVQVNGKLCQPSTILRSGDVLAYSRPPWEEPHAPNELIILYEDQDVLAVHKPSGLQVLPAGKFFQRCLLTLLTWHHAARGNTAEDPAIPAHRLGRGTSGVLLCAKTPAARRQLAQAFAHVTSRHSSSGVTGGAPGYFAGDVDDSAASGIAGGEPVALLHGSGSGSGEGSSATGHTATAGGGKRQADSEWACGALHVQGLSTADSAGLPGGEEAGLGGLPAVEAHAAGPSCRGSGQEAGRGSWACVVLLKRYRALLEGVVQEQQGRVEVPIGRVEHPGVRAGLHAACSTGRPASSSFRVLHRFADSTLVEVTLHTGRPHQIRIHMAAMGHPLVGDPLYGHGGVPKAEAAGQLAGGGVDGDAGAVQPGDCGYALHSAELSLTHPVTGQVLHLAAQPPPPLLSPGKLWMHPAARVLPPPATALALGDLKPMPIGNISI